MKRTRYVILFLLIVLSVFSGRAFGASSCTQAISTQAKELWLSGAFKVADTYKIALYTDTANWNATTTQYSATNEASGTNYTAGGYTCTDTTVSASSTTALLDFTTLTESSVTLLAPVSCALVYDSTLNNSSCTAANAPYPCCTGSGAGTCSNAVLGVFTFSDVQPSAGTLTITFPASGATTSTFRIALQRLWDFWLGTAWASERVDVKIAIMGLQIKAFGR